MGNPSIKKILYFVLGFQICLSIVTVAVDVEYRWLRYFDRKDIRTGPVEPGDQRRIFEPRRTSPDIFPEDTKTDVPMLDEVSPRLTFRIEELPSLGKFILVSGRIKNGDFARLEEYFETQTNFPKVVAFNSPGGTVIESLKIGRLLRSLGVDTLMLPGMHCFSACPYMFGGGKERVAYGRAALGMHQKYFDKSIILPAFLLVEDMQSGQAITMEYLIEMGIDPSLMIFSLKTPPDEIYILVKEELLKTNLVTKFID